MQIHNFFIVMIFSNLQKKNLTRTTTTTATATTENLILEIQKHLYRPQPSFGTNQTDHEFLSLKTFVLSDRIESRWTK